MYIVTFAYRDGTRKEVFRYKEKPDAELHFSIHADDTSNQFLWISLARQSPWTASLVDVEQIALFNRPCGGTLFRKDDKVKKFSAFSEESSDFTKIYRLISMDDRDCSGVILPVKYDSIKGSSEKVFLHWLSLV